MEKQAARTRIVFAGSPSTSWIFVICSLFSWWWWWAACLLLVGIISLALPSNAQLVASCCRRWTSPVEEKNIYNKREKIHRTSTPLEKVDTCGSRKRLWITRWWCWTSTMRGKKMLSFSGRIFSFLEVISVKGAALPPRGCLWTEPPILSDVIYEELLIRKLLLSQKLVKLRIGAVAPLNFGLNKIGSNWGPIFICGACNWCNNPISWAILPLRNFSPTPALCIYSFLIGFFLLGLIAFSLFYISPIPGWRSWCLLWAWRTTWPSWTSSSRQSTTSPLSEVSWRGGKWKRRRGQMRKLWGGGGRQIRKRSFPAPPKINICLSSLLCDISQSVILCQNVAVCPTYQLECHKYIRLFYCSQYSLGSNAEPKETRLCKLCVEYNFNQNHERGDNIWTV